MPNFRDQELNISQNNDYLQARYAEFADEAFLDYGKLVDSEERVDIARYINPYSSYTSFVMGMSLTSLLRLIIETTLGDLKHVKEFNEFGLKIKEIVLKQAPFIDDYLTNAVKHNYLYEDLIDMSYTTKTLSETEMNDFTSDGDKRLIIALLQRDKGMSYNDAKLTVDKLDLETIRKLIRQISLNNDEILTSVRYQFEFPISLIILKHITRHRVQDIHIPNFSKIVDSDTYYNPEYKNEGSVEIAKKAYERRERILKEFKKYRIANEDLIYTLLHGNMINVQTNINARAFMHMTRLRTCTKSQFETQKIVGQMEVLARGVHPLLGENYGPYCKVLKFCPEGNDSCKNRTPGDKVLSRLITK